MILIVIMEDCIVDVPYQPTKEERGAIAELEKKGLVPDDWNSRKRGIKRFKESIRDYMYEKQNGQCAYCRLHISRAVMHVHRDHIVNKSAHPQWIFLPENLCVSCPVCNEYKGETEVMVNPRVRVYPKDSGGFRIIHPLYDKYLDNIELIDGILYRGKTEKDVFTIRTCHLSRVKLAEERVEEKLIAESKGIIAKILGLLSLSEQYVDNMEEFRRFVEDIVKKYKQYH